jgi:hypothetical protein
MKEVLAVKSPRLRQRNLRICGTPRYKKRGYIELSVDTI